MTEQGASRETGRIADQLRRLYDGPSWLGPPLKMLISGIGDDQARCRPIAGAHSIWELVLHMTAWLRIAQERISAVQILDPTETEDWPELAEPWLDAVASLTREIESLADVIQKFPDEQLENTAPAKEQQTYYVLFHGVIQHCAYHSGQIAILRKPV